MCRTATHYGHGLHRHYWTLQTHSVAMELQEGEEEERRRRGEEERGRVVQSTQLCCTTSVVGVTTQYTRRLLNSARIERRDAAAKPRMTSLVSESDN